CITCQHAFVALPPATTSNSSSSETKKESMSTRKMVLAAGSMARRLLSNSTHRRDVDRRGQQGDSKFQFTLVILSEGKDLCTLVGQAILSIPSFAQVF